jgi:heme-degrading monooxygenase HmoA
MAQLIIRHKVKDFGKWKPLFDEHGAKRKAAGSRGGRLFRSEKDPNEVVILFEWEDLGKARKFTESEDLLQTMESAGVVGKPDLYFLEEIGKFTV